MPVADEREPDSAGEAPPRRARHLIAVAGGRGGVGASVVAVNLAVYLAQLGRRVALVDADPSGAQLHTMLGAAVEHRKGGGEESEESLDLVATQVPGLALLPQGYSANSTAPVRPGRKLRWLKAVRLLDVDYVIFDLGAGTAPPTLDLFLG